ncbi:unnamed protein product [Symbiodinium sp. CCMP2592]|nr:unnamed protein product [Symbiodinium sp. CCMP2592]CAE7436686.1 unnamed protein product [Symbiodinium sp. CCMP2592]CAE7785889.1 unnamed protein product [Symbiodinium sp. CCMP2592]
MERRQMARHSKSLEPGPTCIVILGDSPEEKQALKRRILQVCRARRDIVIHGCTSFLSELHKPAFYEHLPAQIVYLCCESKTLHWLTDPVLDVTAEPDDKDKKNCHIILATRLLGGYAPILQLRAAALSPHQIYLGKQMPDWVGQFWARLHRGLVDSRIGTNVSMVLRDKKKKQLILACIQS